LTAGRVRKALSEVHSAKKAWEITLLLFRLTVTWPLHSFNSPKLNKVMVPEYMPDEFQQFQVCWITSTIANSPVAALIFTLLVLIVVAFTPSLRTLSDIVMLRHYDYDDKAAKKLELLTRL
jgi:hypothetical protein